MSFSRPRAGRLSRAWLGRLRAGLWPVPFGRALLGTGLESVTRSHRLQAVEYSLCQTCLLSRALRGKALAFTVKESRLQAGLASPLQHQHATLIRYTVYDWRESGPEASSSLVLISFIARRAYL